MVTVFARALHRKLLRELWRLKGQLFSISLVVAMGVLTVVTMRGTYEALFNSRAQYYSDSRFADVWASLERAPESVRTRIEALPGVAAVETRVTSYATLDLPWLDGPGVGLFSSVPELRRPRVNDIHIAAGRYIAPGRADEVVASSSFATWNGVTIGDTVRAVINGRRREMTIVGLAVSPEHSYSVPPGALYPDDARYGVFWVGREVIGASLDMDHGFNEVVLTLTTDANSAAVLRDLDRVLAPYGGRGAYLREDQTSHQILDAELEGNRATGTVIPAVFLGVAAFLLNLVLGRLIASQRTEIGTLKAFGYTNREIGWHYLSYALCAVAVGTVLGAVGGIWAGDAMVQLYGTYFNFPSLQYELSWSLVLIGAGVSLAAALIGGWGAVRSATSLAPAEAMRPESPPRFTPGWVERAGVGALLSASGRLVLRNMERRPVRVALASLGVAFSVSILVIGLSMTAGVESMMELQFQVAQREDLSLTFNRPVGRSVESELNRLAGVTRVELFHAVPVRLSSGHREREVGLTGLEADSELRRIINAQGEVHPLPLEGIVLSKLLADGLRVSAGDVLTVEVLTGSRPKRQIPVSGVIEDFLGVSAYMTLDELWNMAHEGPVVSGAFLRVSDDERGALNARLKELPAVADVASPAQLLAAFQKLMDESLLITVGFLLVFAGIIAGAVIYNGTRIALSERARELASLRVLGFTRGEVATLLLGEQAVLTLVAIPVGWALGYWLSVGIAASVASETYRLPVVMGDTVLLYSALTTLVFAVGSGLLVRRRMDRMDLISVLKTRE